MKTPHRALLLGCIVLATAGISRAAEPTSRPSTTQPATRPTTKPVPLSQRKLKKDAPVNVRTFWEASTAKPKEKSFDPAHPGNAKLTIEQRKQVQIYQHEKAMEKKTGVATPKPETDEFYHPLPLPPAIEVGSIGKCFGYQVQQVVKDDMIVILQVQVRERPLVDTGNPVANQRFAYTSYTHLVIKPLDNPVWLTGISTVGMVDDHFVKDEPVLEVIGTKQYPTAIGGVKTVFLVRPFNIEDWLE